MGDPFRDLALKSLQPLLEATKKWNIPALAQLLTALDRIGPKALKSPALLQSRRVSFRIGITGPPGAGKSTLIHALITELRARNLSVAVLAVDPSSPFSHGAILGDRIRFNTFQNDAKVFVRSIGSRGSLGGLSASAYLMLRAFDHFGFDIALVETVGVGQTELEIMNVADCTTVVLVPESGDGIQAMKAGLLEIADLFIVNKSDRAGADSLARELELSVHGAPKKSWPSLSAKEVVVLKTNALKAQGVSTMVDHLLAFRNLEKIKLLRQEPARLRAEAIALLRWQWEQSYLKRAAKVKTTDDLLRAVLEDQPG